MGIAERPWGQAWNEVALIYYGGKVLPSIFKVAHPSPYYSWRGYGVGIYFISHIFKVIPQVFVAKDRERSAVGIAYYYDFFIFILLVS